MPSFQERAINFFDESISQKVTDKVVKAIPASSTVLKKATERLYKKGLVREKGKGWVENPMDKFSAIFNDNEEHSSSSESKDKEPGGYLDFMKHKFEKLVKDPKMVSPVRWYLQQVSELPDKKVEKVDLADGTNWIPKMSKDNPNAIESIVHPAGRLLSLEGRMVDGGYVYPMANQVKEEVEFKQDGENFKFFTSGVVGIFRNSKNKALFTIRQEPGVNAPKYAVIGPSFQASVTNLSPMVEKHISESKLPTDKKSNPVLDEFDQIGSKEITGATSLLNSTGVVVYLAPNADAQRVIDTTVGFTKRVSKKTSTRLEGGKSLFLTSYQLNRLSTVGVVNSFAANGDRPSKIELESHEKTQVSGKWTPFLGKKRG